MTAFTPSGIEYLIPDDDFDPTGLTLAPSLDSRIIVPVPNATAAEQLVAELAAAGWEPSIAEPLHVWRADAPAHRRMESTTDGTTWTPWSGTDSGWTNPASKATNWSTNTTFQSRLIGNRVQLLGKIQHNTTTSLAASNNLAVLTLPSGHRPPADRRFDVTRWVASGVPEFRGEAAITVHANGAVDLHVVEGTTGVFVDNVTFLND